jgi:AcrR family transcriptional regulator
VATSRRIGAPDAKNRVVLLDAAERVLVRDGYASVTSRRVAAEAGLKPQLVHYYFRTMDELFVEVFRRRAEQNLERLDRALAADRPLRALWEFSTDTTAATFTTEFVALANHRKAVRAEIASYAERFRRRQLEGIESLLDERGIGRDEMPAVVALLVMTGLSQVLALETALGVTAGHAETLAFVDERLEELESRTREQRRA